MSSLSRALFVIFMGLVAGNFAAANPNDTLRCGGTYHGREIKFFFNPTGEKFDYAGNTQDDYFLVYVKYTASKNRLEVTTMEFLPDDTYDLFKQAVMAIPGLEYLRKPILRQQVGSLYDGYFNYRSDQGDKVISFSCAKK